MSFYEAELPGRGVVRISQNPTNWPSKTGETGYVPRWAIIPDPEQPRSYFDPDELRELGNSLKVNGQREIAKTRLLTEEERRALTSTRGREPRYMLVSGERRWQAAGPKYADLVFFEIRVAAYESAGAQFEDAFLLNESREDIPPLDAARSLARILQERCRGSVAELCRRVGKSRQWVDDTLSLNDLTEKARALMHPSLKKQMLTKATGILLAKLRSELQDEFADRIKNGEAGRTATEQRRWIEERLVAHHGQGSNPKAVKTDHVRDRLMGLPVSVRIRLLHITKVSDEDFDKACDSIQTDTLGELLQSLEAIQTGITTVHNRLKAHHEKRMTAGERIATLLPGWVVVDYYENGRTKLLKQAVSAEKYQQLGQQGYLAWQKENLPKPPELPAVVSADQWTDETVRLLHELWGDETLSAVEIANRLGERFTKNMVIGKARRELLPPRKETQPVTQSPPATVRRVVQAGQEVRLALEKLTVFAWDPTSGRDVVKEVSPAEYLTLWDKGHLQFQRLNRPRPSHLPSREEAAGW